MQTDATVAVKVRANGNAPIKKLIVPIMNKTKYVLVNVSELNRQCDIHARRISSRPASTCTLLKSARRFRRNVIKYSKPYSPVMA